MDEEILIKNIIERYGEIINLRKTPHLIIEILRTHGSGVVNVPDAGVSVSGVGKPPGPTNPKETLGNVVDNAQLMKEILKLSKQVQLLTEGVMNRK